MNYCCTSQKEIKYYYNNREKIGVTIHLSGDIIHCQKD